MIYTDESNHFRAQLNFTKVCQASKLKLQLKKFHVEREVGSMIITLFTFRVM